MPQAPPYPLRDLRFQQSVNRPHAVGPSAASWRQAADDFAQRAITHHQALAAEHLREAEAIRQTARRAGVLS